MSYNFNKITIGLLLTFTLFTINCFGQHTRDTRELDLSPTKWIWYSSDRVLQNTFVLFRKEFNLNSVPDSATGWILADSRYQLFVKKGTMGACAIRPEVAGSRPC